MPEAPRRVRIGIDVGGTFTHAVALDAASLELLGKVRTPTTHDADEGVALGVVHSLQQLLAACGREPAEVVFIAHSTTQATNALLEGDVAPVGIVGMGRGIGGWLARRQTRIAPIELAPGRPLQTCFRWLDSRAVSAASAQDAIAALHAEGARVIVAAEAFSVDDPRNEALVCRVAGRLDLPATATHHVSQLHGLRIRTRTAVINASMIPRMLATADMTERAVRQAGITAPLMIMRSDGGVMDLNEMRRRPILTMLSGPAAGVAAALLYARISDAVFLEVGGTSTDISVIRNGRCQVRSAEIGGQRLHVSTLDVRTVGVAGGSLVYLDASASRLRQVGPRSAHIAGLPYASFRDGDPREFVADSVAASGLHPSAAPQERALAADHFLTLRAGDRHFAVTPTCCSNALGLVPPDDPARATGDNATVGLDAVAAGARHGFADGAAAAEAILATALRRLLPTVEGLIRDYRLEPGVLRMVGGGGGASAIVPFAARAMNLPHEYVCNADVISAIGVALALVRDSVERTVIAPAEDDIRRIRSEAFEAVLRMGAAPDTIRVHVEVDARRNLLRATAEGATEISDRPKHAGELDPSDRRALVSASLAACAPAEPRPVGHAAGFELWTADYEQRRLWGLVHQPRRALRALDAAGAIRFACNHADLCRTTVGQAEQELADLAERHTRYSDAGATIPRCFVLLDGRIIDLSGLAELSQVLEVLRLELRDQPPAADCWLLVELG